MDDITSGIVDHPPLPQETSAPNTECADSVGQGEPQGNKQHPCSEAHSAQHRSCKQDQCNGSKLELEKHQAGHVKECRGRRRRRKHRCVQCAVTLVVVLGSGRKVSLCLQVFVAQSGALPHKGRNFSPNDILYAHVTQQSSDAAYAYRARKAEFTAHFFFTMLP